MSTNLPPFKGQKFPRLVHSSDKGDSIDDLPSSCLQSASYDESEQTLTVTFAKDGSEYQYFGVDRDTWNELITADSIGKYFNSDIRD